MSLPRGPGFRPFARIEPPPRPKEGPVLAVGGWAIVTCQGRVTLTDDAGIDSASSMPDGTQVRILAWRPRRGGTRYRIASVDGRLEGWVGAACLKARPVAPPPPKPVVVAAPRVALPIRAERVPKGRTPSKSEVAKRPTIKAARRTSKVTTIGTR